MFLKTYSVYILKCNDGSYYTGVTNDLERRVAEHKEGLDAKSYTFKRRPVTLVFQYEFQNSGDAIEIEKQIKKWSVKKKQALINGNFDLLPALSKKIFNKK